MPSKIVLIIRAILKALQHIAIVAGIVAATVAVLTYIHTSSDGRKPPGPTSTTGTHLTPPRNVTKKPMTSASGQNGSSSGTASSSTIGKEVAKTSAPQASMQSAASGGTGDGSGYRSANKESASPTGRAKSEPNETVKEPDSSGPTHTESTPAPAPTHTESAPQPTPSPSPTPTAPAPTPPPKEESSSNCTNDVTVNNTNNQSGGNSYNSDSTNIKASC